MAQADIKILKGGLTVQRFRTEANAYVGLEEGDAVKIGGTGTNFAIPCLNGDPEQGTDIFLGVTKNAATNTAAANGVVDVELIGPGTVLEGKAATPANIASAAALLGVIMDFVCFDRSADTAAGILTIDEDEGTDTAIHGLMILDGDISAGKLFVTPGLNWTGTV